jgi:phosphoglycolate phosphatase-like HAD superfamily hydrolase
MAIKAIIFDLDGTIAAFNLDYRMVRVEVRSFLIGIGVPPSVLVVNESIFEMLKKTEIYLKNSGKTEGAIRKARENALAIAEKHEFEAAKNTRLLPGVLGGLKALKKMGLKLGLCTINSRKSTEYILQHFRIGDYFDGVVPRDNVKYVKPNIEHLEAAFKALKVKPREAMVVGDGGVDMRCAKELKAVAVGLPTGASSPKELIDSGADYLITSIAELPTIVESINKNLKALRKPEA